MDKKFIVLMAGIIFLAVMIGQKVIYIPKIAEIKRLNEERIEEIKKKELLYEIEVMEKRIDAYKQNFSPVKEMSKFLSEVVEIANQSGISLSSITPQNPIGTGAYTRFSVEVNTRCSYRQAVNFISKLESSEGFMGVDRMDLRSLGGPEEKMVGEINPTVNLIISTVSIKE